MNPNWSRWIHASLIDYFTKYCDKNSITMFVEAQERMPADKKDWIEFRWEGPNANEVSQNVWILNLSVNLYVFSITGREQTYQHKKIVGSAEASLIKDIPIYRYGETVDVDTQDLLGCLQIVDSGNRDSILTNYFGKIQTDVMIEQSYVEAPYRMILTV